VEEIVAELASIVMIAGDLEDQSMNNVNIIATVIQQSTQLISSGQVPPGIDVSLLNAQYNYRSLVVVIKAIPS